MFNFQSLRSAALIFIVSILLAGSAGANTLKSIPVGPKVGTTVPEVAVTNYQGKLQSLSDLYGEKGVVIVFFRSADWCPFCKKHLIELNEVAKQVKASGYNMVGLSYDSNEVMASFATMNNLHFDLLSDVNNQTIKSYGVLNKDYQEGHRFYGIPYPGIMVITPDGKLQDKYFYMGYKKRVRAEKLLATLGN